MTEKLQKVLARLGLGSRRTMETWIKVGRVKVNGKLAQLGDRVSATDELQVDNKFIRQTPTEQQATRVLVYHKPVGEICTRHDPQGRPTVFTPLPPLTSGRWISIGRLDINTSGLLLFANNGELANRLMHPSHHVPREYAVRILGNVDDAMLKRLTQGVLLEEGKAQFESIVAGGGRGCNRWFYVVVMMGRNRIVRRLWESQNVTVSRLKRVRFGDIVLDKTLREGQWCELSEKEIKPLIA